jgi:hypothetical protein
MTHRPSRLSSSTSLRAVDPKPWTISTERHPHGYIFTRMTGIADAEFAEEVRSQLLRHLDPGHVDWIPDASHVTNFKPSLLPPAPNVLKAFSLQGGRHCVAVITSGPIRMAASTISMMATSIGAARINIAGSMEEALRMLDELRQTDSRQR